MPARGFWRQVVLVCHRALSLPKGSLQVVRMPSCVFSHAGRLKTKKVTSPGRILIGSLRPAPTAGSSKKAWPAAMTVLGFGTQGLCRRERSWKPIPTLSWRRLGRCLSTEARVDGSIRVLPTDFWANNAPPGHAKSGRKRPGRRASLSSDEKSGRNSWAELDSGQGETQWLSKLPGPETSRPRVSDGCCPHRKDGEHEHGQKGNRLVRLLEFPPS